MPLPIPMDFLTTFRERRDCFTELLELSNEQMRLIESDDYPQLLAILGRKQRILGRLEEIHRLHPRMAAEWKQFRDTLIPAARSACDQCLTETERLLEQLMSQEREGTERIAERRQQTRTELQTLTDGTRANQAYGQPHIRGTNRLLSVDQ